MAKRLRKRYFIVFYKTRGFDSKKGEGMICMSVDGFLNHADVVKKIKTLVDNIKNLLVTSFIEVTANDFAEWNRK